MAGCPAAAQQYEKAMCASHPVCFGTDPDLEEHTPADAANNEHIAVGFRQYYTVGGSWSEDKQTFFSTLIIFAYSDLPVDSL